MKPLKRNNKQEQRNRMEHHRLADESLLKRTLAEALGRAGQNVPNRSVGLTHQSCGSAK